MHQEGREKFPTCKTCISFGVKIFFVEWNCHCQQRKFFEGRMALRSRDTHGESKNPKQQQKFFRGANGIAKMHRD